MTGLASVTFRNLPAERIIALAKEAGLDGVEWGSDVHVPVGRIACAEAVFHKTAAAGLRVLSYGSYYRLSGRNGASDAFLPVLDTAAALHAPNIRIWAGDLSPGQVDGETMRRMSEELSAIGEMAKRKRIRISLEYHRHTLTETADSLLHLLGQAGCDNVYTYWQPDPDLTHMQRCAEIRKIRPHISNIHVFEWTKGDVRRPLEEGADNWKSYIDLANLSLESSAYLLEFVKDDKIDNLERDALVLRQWLQDTAIKPVR